MGERRKAQGTRPTAVKTFFPCALSLEPYASLDSGYWLLELESSIQYPKVKIAESLYGKLSVFTDLMYTLFIFFARPGFRGSFNNPFALGQ